MKTKFAIVFVVAMLFVGVTAALAFGLLDPTTTWHVTPASIEYNQDNRSCPAGSFLVKDTFQSVTTKSGIVTENFTVNGMPVTVNITVNDDNSFDFAVIGGVMPRLYVKGGGATYLLYQYEPPVAGATNAGPVSYDTGLHDGVNDQGIYQDVSHLDLCVTPVYPLTATKTAAGSYDRTITWDLTKKATPASHSGFIGAVAGSSTWEVKATKNVALSNYKVTGEITINNPNGFPVPFGVVDYLNDVNKNSATVTCPSYTVPANGSVVCTYTTGDLGSQVGDLNTAEVTPTDPAIKGAKATAPYVWTAKTTGDDMVKLDDDRNPTGFPADISDSATYTYNEIFTCSSNPADYAGDGTWTNTYPNTATLTGASTNKTAYAEVGLTCYAPVVWKDAKATYNEVHTWDVDKTVEPVSQSAFAGDTVAFKWKVVVTETVKDEAFKVTGSIKVKNPAPTAMTLTLADALDVATPVTISCTVGTLTGDQLVIPANTEALCTYTANPGDLTATKNTVTATFNSIAFSYEAPFTWDQTVIDGSVMLDDDQVPTWPVQISDGGTFYYDDSYTCSKDPADYGKDPQKPSQYTYTEDNLAKIYNSTKTLDQDGAQTAVTCYKLDVTKNAEPTFTRKYDWKIDKVGDQTALTLSPGQQFLVNYTVKVDVMGYTDSKWAVTGKINVANPAPMAATLTGVADVISPAIAATVDCGVTFPYTLAAGQTLTCSYSADLPDATARTNTATATLQNSPSGTTDFSGTASVDFTNATMDQVDECITVTDDKYGSLGTVCANAAPRTITYSMYVGPYAQCGTYTFTNVASFVTNDTGATGSDDHTVAIDVPCLGCTLTPGYWKTHSSYGPAKYDDTWALLPNGANTPFFKSGQTYYQVLWTSPSGNAYYILAHAYIAAQLNMLNGADPTAALAAYNQATTLLSTYTPAQVAAMKSGNPVRKQFISLAYTLDQYNNGYIGPGHCSE